MNMNVSPSLMTATISASQPGSKPPPPPDGNAGPDNKPPAIKSIGSSLTEGAQDSILAEAAELEKSGASSEEVKSFVASKLEANGVGVPDGQQRKGQLVDMKS